MRNNKHIIWDFSERRQRHELNKKEDFIVVKPTIILTLKQAEMIKSLILNKQFKSLAQYIEILIKKDLKK